MRRSLRTMRLAALGAALAGVVPPVGPGPVGLGWADTVCPGEAQGFQRLKSADAEIAYRWEPAELKVGQFFAAEVVACRAPDRESVGQVAIDATMPAHGHGMNYRPKAEPTGPGRYRFTGLMLHMPGTWRVTFDLMHGPRRTRLTHEVNLKP
jgi:YtkA-like